MFHRMLWVLVLAMVLAACKSQPKNHYSTQVPVANPAAPAQPGPVVQPVIPAKTVQVPEPVSVPPATAKANTPLQPVTSEIQKPKTAPTPAVEPQPAVSAGPAALQKGREHLAANRLVQARAVLNRALVLGEFSKPEATEARRLMMQVNRVLIFSDRVVSGDAHAKLHTVQAGEHMSKVARHYRTDWSFVSRINGGLDARRVRVGQKIKVVPGPYHVVVDKSAHRLDLFIGKGPTDSNRLYVRSFKVGLGEGDSTPAGMFEVKNRVVNPGWIHPRTGKYYDRNAKDNPIGEFWVGLSGLDAGTRNKKGYGLHGTIEPESIGRNASMGCVRMLPDDIALVHSVMESRASRVKIIE